MGRLQLRNLYLHETHSPALNDINLTVEPGHCCVLLGPAGSGKSTLLRVLAGLRQPSAGQILIDGLDVTDQPPPARDLALVFSQHPSYPGLSVGENIAFGLQKYGLTAEQMSERVRSAAQCMGFEDRLSQSTRALSQAALQRLAIARALARRPSLYVLDDPLRAMDAEMRAAWAPRLRALLQAQQPASVFYATSDVAEAGVLGDKIAVMQNHHAGNGRASIVQTGGFAELHDYPEHRSVASLMGRPSMNIFPARVTAVDDRSVTASSGALSCVAQVDGRDVEVGEQIFIGIRPEHIEVGTGTIAAVVTQRVHARPMDQVHVSITQQNESEAPRAFVALLKPESNLRVGDQVALTLPSHALHVFRADGRAQTKLYDSNRPLKTTALGADGLPSD